MSSLTVVCPNARRCKISVTPSTLIRQVLEECCLKQGYDVDSYILHHGGKPIDESLPFRLAGLPNNASLDLIETKEKKGNQEAEIALQTPEGRKIAKFSTTTTLLEMLKTFSTDFDKDLLQVNPGEVATLTYLNKQWRGDSLLTVTTLKSIGITSGKVLLRYSVTKLSDEECAQIEEEIKASAERRKKLEEDFIKQKANNDARAALEAKYQRDLDERQALEKKRMEDELRQREFEMQESSTNQSSSTAMDTTEPTSSSILTETPSSSVPTGLQNRSDIERLQATLRILDSSLQSGRSDTLVDTLMNENGTLRSDVDMQDLTQAAQTPYQPAVNEFANFKFPEHKISVPYDTDDRKIQEEIAVIAPENRRVVLFDRTLPIEKKKVLEEVDESVYETTVQDIKVLQRSLTDQIKTQRAFVPKAFIDAKNRQRQLEAYKNTVIRFLLPENKAIQACFYSQESVSSIHDFVESLFTSPSIKYNICFFLKEKLQRDKFKSLIDAGLAPKSNLILSIKDNLESVFDQSLFHEVTLEEADAISADWLSVNTRYEPYNPTVGPESQRSQNKRNAGSIHSSEESSGPPAQRRNVEGLPKWLKR